MMRWTMTGPSSTAAKPLPATAARVPAAAPAAAVPAPAVPPAAAVSGETAEELFRALGRLRAAGRLGLRLDFGRLHHIDCPVAMEADGNIWAYAVLAVAALSFWLFGWHGALAAGVLGTVVYYTLGRRYIHGRMQRRVEENALGNLDVWRRLWRFGGIVLVPQGGGGECAAPEGNWMALVRLLLAGE